MAIVQNQIEYRKPDLAIRSPKFDLKLGLASAAVVATLSVGNMPTPFSALALRLQSVDNARASVSGWASQDRKKFIHNYIQSSKWGQLSQSMFDELAISEPKRLLEIVKHGDLEPSLLTYASESIGRIENMEVIQEGLNILLSLSKHNSSLVREGSVYGMANFLNNSLVGARLSEMLVSDTSDGVRSAVRDVI
jgi:hypothetical protein